jgi:hypothetical protein
MHIHIPLSMDNEDVMPCNLLGTYRYCTETYHFQLNKSGNHLGKERYTYISIYHTSVPQKNGTDNLMMSLPPPPPEQQVSTLGINFFLTSSYSYDRPFSSCHQNRGNPPCHYYCHDHTSDDLLELTLHA